MRSANDAACGPVHAAGDHADKMPVPHFLAQSSTMPLAGVGHDTVQALPPLWMLGGRKWPSLDRQVAAAMI